MESKAIQEKQKVSFFVHNCVELASFWLMLKEQAKCVLVWKGFYA